LTAMIGYCIWKAMFNKLRRNRKKEQQISVELVTQLLRQTVPSAPTEGKA
jgi:hypothetical protein